MRKTYLSLSVEERAEILAVAPDRLDPKQGKQLFVKSIWLESANHSGM
jgi:hypothetical protein